MNKHEMLDKNVGENVVASEIGDSKQRKGGHLLERVKFFSQVTGYALICVLSIFGLMSMLSVGTAGRVSAANQLEAPADILAAVPATMNYQGVLRDAQGELVNGNRDMTVRIYDAVMNGNQLHEETFTEVSVREGVFNVVLGDAVSLDPIVFADGPRFIGLTVAPDTDEMVPRQRLHPVPWAQFSTNANTANTATTADTATTAANADTATTLVPNALINDNVFIDNSSILYLRNSAQNSLWGMQVDSAGVLRFTGFNTGNIRLSLNQNGNVLIPGDLDVREVRATGRVVAALGFNGRCLNPGENFNSGTCNQDVAETFGTDERTEPGDLVVFIPEDREFPAVQLSTQAYEKTIVGVVSTDPGLVFDQGETRLSGDNSNLITDEKTVVAMVGRVPTKFSLENGPIAVGDPLTSSSTPGMAMKATEAGQIIGYAMQSSDAAEDGKILVWLQLGTYIPPETLAAMNAGGHDAASAATVANLEAQVAALTAQVEALDTGHNNARWPWGLPLFGSLIMLGAVVGTRNRFWEGS